ncbi:MAG: sialate O-acetylesterase [Segetibacter sp.]|nr:sialate O-acetylesterase [Segetibacter sp.]
MTAINTTILKLIALPVMKIIFFVLVSLAFASSKIFAQASSDNRIDSNFHLYILMGQSNMAGRGEITEKYRNESHPRVFMLDKNNNWVPAHHPLHFDKPIAGVGPGLSFAIRMANQNPGIKVGLIPCAVGGSSINSWQPGGYDSATKTHPYDDAMLRIKLALKSGVIKGMLWHQGESDSQPEAANEYIPKLQVLIQRIRSICDNHQLPVVAGELGRYKQQYQNINTQLHRLPSIVTFTAVASSEDLTDKGDSTHFDSSSAEKLGERFAEKIILLQKSFPFNKKHRKRKS